MTARRILAGFSTIALVGTLLGAVPAVATPSPFSPSLWSSIRSQAANIQASFGPKTQMSGPAAGSISSPVKSVITYETSHQPQCQTKVVDVNACDPEGKVLVPSEYDDFPGVNSYVSGLVFHNLGGKRGVMETTWNARIWRDDKVPPEEPISGVTVYARWYDGSSGNGAWSPRFTATTKADGTYKLALRPFVDAQGVMHTFRGTGGTSPSSKDQMLRVSVQTSDHRLVWAPNNGGSLSQAIVGRGLADNVSWRAGSGSGYVTGYNFSLAPKDISGPAKRQVVVEKQTGGPAPGTCNRARSANYFKVMGSVFWDYAQNRLRQFDRNPVDNRIYASSGDWQPTPQSAAGDQPAKGGTLNYYVLAWVPRVDSSNPYDNANPDRAWVGWGKVKDDGTYELLVNVSDENASLAIRDARLNHIMLQLVQADPGKEPVLKPDYTIGNVRSIDSQYGFWNPTAGLFRSWKDFGGSNTGTGLQQRYQGVCTNNDAYGVLYNANFAVFPWQAVAQTKVNDSKWSQRTTAIQTDTVNYRITGLAPLGEYRLIADQNTMLVDSFSTDASGTATGTFTIPSSLAATGWTNTEHDLNVVLPGVTRVDLTKSPVVASSILNLVPYRVETKPIEMTVGEEPAQGNASVRVEGATLQECAWGEDAPTGLTLQVDSANNACKVSGKSELSGSFPTVVKVKTDQDSAPTSWNVVVRVHPKVLAQQSGPVATQGESAVPRAAGVGVSYVGQVSVAKDKSSRTMNLAVSGNSGPISEVGGVFDLGHGLKLVQGSGQIIGTPTLEENETSANITFKVAVTDQDGLVGWQGGQVQPPVTFTINVASPLRLLQTQLPTAFAGKPLQKPDGTAVYLRVAGGANTAISDGLNTYSDVELVTSAANTPIPDSATFASLGLQALAQSSSAGGKLLQFSGVPNAESVTAPTVLYLPVQVVDSVGRVLKGTDNLTLPQVKALKEPLNGSEGWVRLVVLPEVGPGTLPEGIVGESYPSNTIAQTLQTKGLGQSVSIGGKNYRWEWANFSFSASGLPAGLTMGEDGAITGIPLNGTNPNGTTVTITLSGKTGTLAEGTTLNVPVKLRIKSNFAVSSPISAKLIGGETYDANNPLKTSTGMDVPTTINATGGIKPYTYTLQVHNGTSFVDAAKDGDRFIVPELDLNSRSGLFMSTSGQFSGSVLGNKPFPRMRIVVSDSDTVTCTVDSAHPKPCTLPVELNLSREDTRRTLIKNKALQVDKSAPSQGQLPTYGGSGAYTQVKFAPLGTWPANVTLTISDGTNEKTISSATGSEVVLGNGVDPITVRFKVSAAPDAANGISKNAFKVWVLDQNGNPSLYRAGSTNLADQWISLDLDVIDQRIPQADTSANKEFSGPEAGVPLEAKGVVLGNVRGLFDQNSAEIQCYVTSHYSLNTCPTTAEEKALLEFSEAPGIRLNPEDGSFLGVPQASTAGRQPITIRAISKYGAVSEPVTAWLSIAPSSLAFRPGNPTAVVRAKNYSWAFDPASGGTGIDGQEPYKYHYDLLLNGVSVLGAPPANPLDPSGASKCYVDVAPGAKPVLRCPQSKLPQAATYTLQVSTGSQAEGTLIVRSQDVTFSVYDPLVLQKPTYPGGAVGAPYTDNGATFTFTTVGGNGSNSFFITNGEQTGCSEGWVLPLRAANGQPAESSGLCLQPNGAITGTPTKSGEVDLSGVEVRDTMWNTDSLTNHADYPKSIWIYEALKITSLFPGSGSAGAGQTTVLQVTKEDVIPNEGVKIATISGGLRPFKSLEVTGLDQFQENPNDLTVPSVLGQANSDNDLDVVVKGKWTKITGEGLFLTLKVTGGAGQVATAQVYVHVETDLKFTDKPTEDNPGSQPMPDDSSVSLRPATDPNDPPTLELSIGKQAVEDANGNNAGLTVPKLVTGGVEPYHFTTQPCDTHDTTPGKENNCAIGDTGLFLDYVTGEIYGKPNPGASITGVIVVVDSDSPPQRRTAQLDINIADPRKPLVAQNQSFEADKAAAGNAQVVLAGGSGAYSECLVDPTSVSLSGWNANASLQNGVCTLSWDAIPGAFTNSTITVKIRVKDHNGNWNTSDGQESSTLLTDPYEQSVTLNVTDTRKPAWPSGISAQDLHAVEGQDFGPLTLPVESTGDGTQIVSWTVQGTLPAGIVFSDGKLSGNTVALGRHPLTLVARAYNGETLARDFNFEVENSGLRLVLPAFPKATKGSPYPVSGTIEALRAEDKDGPCSDCRFSIVSTSSEPNTSTPVHVSVDSATGALTFGNWPDSTKTSTVEFKVTKGRAERSVSVIISADSSLSLSPTKLQPVYPGDAATECVIVTGGTGVGYALTGGGAQPDSSQPGRFCLNQSTAETDAGTIKTITVTATDKESPTDPNNKNTQQFTLYLPVRGSLTLSKPSDISVKKNTAIASFTPNLVDNTCFPDFAQTPVVCDATGSTLHWEISGAPAGITINPDSGEISGTPKELFDGNLTVKVNKTKGTYQDSTTTTFHLRVATDLAIPTPTQEIPLNQNGNPSSGLNGSETSVSLLADQSTPGTTGASTGRYSLDGVSPDAAGNYPIYLPAGATGDPSHPVRALAEGASGAENSGLYLTPEGRIGGSLKSGLIADNSLPIVLPVVITETGSSDAWGKVGPSDTTFTLTDGRAPSLPANTLVEGAVGNENQSGQLPWGGNVAKTQGNAYSNLQCGTSGTNLPIGVLGPGGQLPADGSWAIYLSPNGDWQINPKWDPGIVKPANGKPIKTWDCSLTLTGFNTNTAQAQFTLQMEDYRFPKFLSDRDRYVWEGRNIRPFEIVGKWVADPRQDPSVPKPQELAVRNLPDGMFVTNDSTNPTPLTKGQDGMWHCTLGPTSRCFITGWPRSGTAGRTVLDLVVTGVNGQQSESHPVTVVFSSALRLQRAEEPAPATAGKPYEALVATADYTRPADLTDAKIYWGQDATDIDVSPYGASNPYIPNTPAQNNQRAWANTYALGATKPSAADPQPTYGAGGTPKVEIDTARLTSGENLSGWTVSFEATTTQIDPFASATTYEDPVNGQDLVKQSIKLSASAVPSRIGSVRVPLKVTDGHGMVRTLDVIVGVSEDLQWVNAPFNDAAPSVSLGVETAGNEALNASGERLHAVVKGGNGDYRFVLASAGGAAPGLNDAKNLWNNAGYCQLPGMGVARRCIPYPSLGPAGYNAANFSEQSPFTGQEGLFLLETGEFMGKIPAASTEGEYSARVLVYDTQNRGPLEKTVSLSVYRPVTADNSTPNLPEGTRTKPYTTAAGATPVPVFSVQGGRKDTSAANPYSGWGCVIDPKIAALDQSGNANEVMRCQIGPDGTVTISGTPAVTFDGSINLVVTDPDGRQTAKSAQLKINTDLVFVSNPNQPGGSGVEAQIGPDGKPVVDAQGRQTLTITTSGDGNAIEGGINLPVEGGTVTPGAANGTPEGYVYSLEDKNPDGTTTPVAPVPCPPGMEFIPQTSPPVARVCYPVGTTGLILTSDGLLIGTPQPGGKADSVVVVADQQMPVKSTRATNLQVKIADRRPPALNSLIINTQVDATGSLRNLVKDDPLNLVADSYSQEQKQAADALNSAGTHFFTESTRSTLSGTWWNNQSSGNEQTCPAETEAWPDWLTLDAATGEVSVASGKTVPPHLQQGKNYVEAQHTYKFCVWYAGANAVLAPPATLTVNVSDLRQPVAGNDNASRSRDTITPGTTIVSANTVMTWTIAKNLLKADGSNIEKLGGASAGSNVFDPVYQGGFRDTSIPGVEAIGACERSQDPVVCTFKLQGTPTPEAAGPEGDGKTFQLNYRLTLANGQILLISKEVNVTPYTLGVEAGAMPVAWVGEEYTPGPINVTGGGSQNTLAVSGIEGITGYDTATGKFTGSGAAWVPSAANAQTAGSNSQHPGFLHATVSVTDTQACATWNNTGSPCPYTRSTTIDIPVATRPSDDILDGGKVTEGTAWTSDLLLDSPNLKNIPGITQTVISVQSDTGENVSGKVTLTDNRLIFASTLPPGTYIVTVQTQVPGFGNFVRVAKLTVKERPRDSQNNTGGNAVPTPTPGPSANPSGNGIDDSLNLVVRHAGKNREETALAVLDFFAESGPGGATSDGVVPAYPEYADLANKPWSNTAVLVRDDDFADSVVAGPLSAELNAPIVYTPTPSMSHKTMNRLREHGFTRIVIVGNAGAVSENVASTLGQAGFEVERVGGKDRYATATAVADRVLHERNTASSGVFMATGEDYPDALSAAATAIKRRAVVLLTPNKGQQKDTQMWLTSDKSHYLIAVGGPAAGAIDTYKKLVDNKVVGSDRYDTSAMLASSYFPSQPARVIVATGRDFPDATVAAAITAKTGAPLTLTSPDRLAKPTEKFFAGLGGSLQKLDVLGGEGAISSSVVKQIVETSRGSR